jgi:hypothetical protein
MRSTVDEVLWLSAFFTDSRRPVLAFLPMGKVFDAPLAKGAGSYFATLTVNWDDGAADCVAQAPNSRKVKLLDEKSVRPGASAPQTRL